MARGVFRSRRCQRLAPRCVLRRQPIRCSFLVVSLTALLLLTAEVLPAAASGPWRAQIVDAETKQPLEGVVALAVWYKATRTFGGPSEEYHDSEEVLTDKEGRFTIAARSFFSLNPLVFFKGPEFLIFKPGYGRAIWPGYQDYNQWPQERRKALGTFDKLLQLDGIVLELPRLKTLEERKEYVGRVWIGFATVPLERTPLLNKVIKEERRAVGYQD